MVTNYEKIIRENLILAFREGEMRLAQTLPARQDPGQLVFKAFGEECSLKPEGVAFSGKIDPGPKGLVVSLYAAHSNPGSASLEPFKAFKDLPGSMPYQGAFTVNSEEVLVPHVLKIREKCETLLQSFAGRLNPAGAAGDFSLLLYPLPKIALLFIFYLPDEEFPASATCLFSSNALSFIPLDGLADVAEYTAKALIAIASAKAST
jgi:hypothetical protein